VICHENLAAVPTQTNPETAANKRQKEENYDLPPHPRFKNFCDLTWESHLFKYFKHHTKTRRKPPMPGFELIMREIHDVSVHIYEL